MSPIKRRSFLIHSLAATAALGFGVRSAAQIGTSIPPPARPEPKRPAPFDLAQVREFVGVSHSNMARVKELLGREPKLVLASYDWGGGDFETGLGAASHVGSREIALHLLEAGARIDAFCAAMLGEVDVVRALVRLAPATARTRGPHGYTLLYHAGYSGDVAIGEIIAAQLANRGPDFNQALHPATARGHVDFVAWLLKNGVTNPDPKNFNGKTPLDVATERGDADIAELLRTAGGASSR